MRVSGFSFIRNGTKLDYPFLEAIQSVLPLCDEFVVVVGDSEDDTRERLVALGDPRIKIIDTVWDETMREGGRILAQQTDIALDHITGDWGFYIQGDEVLHEKYIPVIRKAMEDNLQKKEVEGLLFRYLHFYGSYDYVGDSSRWYDHEIRIVRNDKQIRSYRDAQGFRKDGRKLRVKEINAEIYHYGWVRDPRAQQLKQESFHRYWHDDQWIKENVVEATEAEYDLLESLKRFEGTHPAVMAERIKRMNWAFNYDPSRKKVKLKDKLKRLVQRVTGKEFGVYRNYEIIK